MHSWPSPTLPSLTNFVVPDALPPLRLFNTAAGAVEATSPGPVASMYVCGITPYDATHMGHAATYVAFDIVNRYWRAGGSTVRYVQNVTDVDDPLLERAVRDGVDWRELAARQTDLFRSDMTALRVIPPTDYVGAVESIPDVSAALERLVADGSAYRVDDWKYPDLYFDIEATGRFGAESGYDETTMLALSAERGGDPDRPGKRHRLDPLLWRMARPGEPAWPSPLGAGRPGWHIECAVIAVNRIGSRIDLQGGGDDLIFPHHECSAAHAEALTGQAPFARHYVHAGMMTLDGEKMSKSLGNLEFVSRLTASGIDAMAIRIALLAGHYRDARPWTREILTAAQRRLDEWRRAAQRTADHLSEQYVTALAEAIADDMDTPRALDVVDQWASDASVDAQPMAAAVDGLLGVSLR